jgi:hypothetical protein
MFLEIQRFDFHKKIFRETHRDGPAVSDDKELCSVVHWTGALCTQTSHRRHVNHCTSFPAFMFSHVLQSQLRASDNPFLEANIMAQPLEDFVSLSSYRFSFLCFYNQKVINIFTRLVGLVGEVITHHKVSSCGRQYKNR